MARRGYRKRKDRPRVRGRSVIIGPSFVPGVAAARADIIRTRIDDFRLLLHRWFERSAGYKGPYDQTPVYIDLLFAFGAARLGNTSMAHSLVGRASETLRHSKTWVHAFLLEAFRYRIDEMLAGRSGYGSLPSELQEKLNATRREVETKRVVDSNVESDIGLGPYAVDRLRHDSVVLDPHESLDPYRMRVLTDKVMTELKGLYDSSNPELLMKRIRLLMTEAAANTKPDLRLEVLTGLLMLSSRVDKPVTEMLLDRIRPFLQSAASARDPVSLVRGAELLKWGLHSAQHIGRPDLVRTLVDGVADLMRSNSRLVDDRDLAPLVDQSLRSLLTMGIKDRAQQLLEQVDEIAFGGQSLEQLAANEGRQWPGRLMLLLGLAAGWLHFEKHERAAPILDAARLLVDKMTGRIGYYHEADYSRLIAAYVFTASRAPIVEALKRLEDLFTSNHVRQIPNTLTTRAYYSLTHFHVAETLMLSLCEPHW